MNLPFKPPKIDEKSIAELLSVSPEAYRAFENAYKKEALNVEEDNFFKKSSKEAARARADKDKEQTCPQEMIDRIIEELLADTKVYKYCNDKVSVNKMLPAPKSLVSKDDINTLSINARPQLTGSLMIKDLPSEDTADTLMSIYKAMYDKTLSPEMRKYNYHMFRQGLDILDVDPLTYEIIGTNKNSMGYWFPILVNAVNGKNFFKIPNTTIAKLPIPLLQLTRLEYNELTSSTIKIVNGWAKKAFDLNPKEKYFVKTGTYSSKFDFRNAKVEGSSEVNTLGEYLLFIHFQALQMASPLSQPCIYGVSTTNEWVVREFIDDVENNPCIYKGMPLHTEYRVFVDADNKTVLGCMPYWDPETMKHRFEPKLARFRNPHDFHDYQVYLHHENLLMERYNANVERVKAEIANILPDLALKGQWSIDVMQNGDDFYIIDMALAENSAFYECVPKELRRPTKENWLPEIKE